MATNTVPQNVIDWEQDYREDTSTYTRAPQPKATCAGYWFAKPWLVLTYEKSGSQNLKRAMANVELLKNMKKIAYIFGAFFVMNAIFSIVLYASPVFNNTFDDVQLTKLLNSTPEDFLQKCSSSCKAAHNFSDHSMQRYLQRKSNFSGVSKYSYDPNITYTISKGCRFETYSDRMGNMTFSANAISPFVMCHDWKGEIQKCIDGYIERVVQKRPFCKNDATDSSETSSFTTIDILAKNIVHYYSSIYTSLKTIALGFLLYHLYGFLAFYFNGYDIGCSVVKTRHRDPFPSIAIGVNKLRWKLGFIGVYKVGWIDEFKADYDPDYVGNVIALSWSLCAINVGTEYAWKNCQVLDLIGKWTEDEDLENRDSSDSSSSDSRIHGTFSFVHPEFDGVKKKISIDQKSVSNRSSLQISL
eukprot:g374.t1